MEVRLFCVPTNTVLITENSELNCSVQAKSTYFDNVSLSFSIQMVDVTNNSEVIYLGCFLENPTFILRNDIISDSRQCQASLGEGLDWKSTIFNKGVGTYEFKIIPTIDRQQYPETFLNKRLNVVSANEEIMLKNEREGLRMTAFSVIFSIVVFIMFEFYKHHFWK